MANNIYTGPEYEAWYIDFKKRKREGRPLIRLEDFKLPKSGREQLNEWEREQNKKAKERSYSGSTPKYKNPELPVSEPKKASDYWTRIPKKWWREGLKGLTPVERCVLIELKLYVEIDKKYSPSQATMARDIEISKKSVIRGLKGLERKNRIEVDRSNHTRLYYTLL